MCDCDSNRDTEEFHQVGGLGVRTRSGSINNCKGLTMSIRMCGTETWVSVDIQDYRRSGLILEIKAGV